MFYMYRHMKCLICNKECKTIGSLGNHIVKYHGNIKEYYDKFLKKENEGKCKSCGGNTVYHNLKTGYRHTCSQTCSRKLMNNADSRKKSKLTMLKKYGVEYASQIDGIGKIISEKAKIRLMNKDERIKISIKTKEAMNRPEVRKKYLESIIPMSDENKKKLSERMKKNFGDLDFRKKFFTNERNEKISLAKIEYWKNNADQKIRVGNIWKLLKKRDEAGWRKRLMEISKKGFEKIYSPNGDTSLEIKLYSMLSNENIIFIKKYELDGKIYDAFLPEKNILIEIDGDFWHKQTLNECKYKYQTESYYNDIVKNEIASNNNIKLIRIREKNIPNTITEIL